MSGNSLADEVRTFDQLLGISPDAPWFYPPPTDDLIKSNERALGHELPKDLLELYRVHNGGFIFDAIEWTPLVDRSKWPSPLSHLDLEWFVAVELAERAGVMPGPRTLQVASASHRMILYEMDDHPGRLLNLMVANEHALIPLCRSLRAFVDCQVDLAENGYIYLERNGPHFGPGPGQSGLWSDEFVDRLVGICSDHGVCPAYYLGNDIWLQRPEAAAFGID